jgi:molybdate transport system ATP-binding protein
MADGAPIAEGLTVVISQTDPVPLTVDLSVGQNELLALVGPSGAGKSTLLRVIAGLARPASGEIAAAGESWFSSARGIDLAPQARAVGFVFQDYALFPHLTALENVAIVLRSPDANARRDAARSILARVHLDHLADRRPASLSGGERQRVAIARALARAPRVLLLDEPFSAVDRMTREHLKRELAALRLSLEIPIVLVTHDIAEAFALADRVAVLHKGKILQTGTPDDIRRDPASTLVADILGLDRE